MFTGIEKVEYCDSDGCGGNSMLYVQHSGGFAEIYAAHITPKQWDELKEDCIYSGGEWWEDGKLIDLEIT